MKSSMLSVWNGLWNAHDRTKRLLLFAVPTSRSAASKQPSETTGTSGKAPRPYKLPQLVGLFLGPLLFFSVILFYYPEGLSYEGRMVLATTLWVATWWITEAIPIPATSLLPLILLPITQGLDGDTAASSYGDPIVFLFLGGFLIAMAMEKWNLHKRIALNIISVVGTSTSRIVLGFMIATGFLSMWVSNTAAVMMMLPIGTAIIYQASQAAKSSKQNIREDNKKFEKSLVFAIGYAGTIGGLGTLIGTPPNIILAAMASSLFGVEISFGGWMLIAVPIVIILLFSAWIYLTRVVFRIKMKELPGGKDLILKEKRDLGKMSFEEKAVLAVFTFAAFMWVSRTFLWQEDALLEIIAIPGISDTTIAVLAGVILFLIPSMNKKGQRILDWDVSKELPWGVLLLFGGGLAIAAGFTSSGLSQWMGDQLTVLEGLNIFVIIIISTTLVLFLTEITSNTATATMILPVMASLALALDVHPYAIMVPAAMAANCAFMLPVGTPPNAIIFASGKITIAEMVRTGFVLNIFTLILVILGVFALVGPLWGLELNVYPESWK
ncbi:SLC13 family permease [Terribacillus saccharophilus]|uniref:Sodium-dependent dicarboxylate transporter SdcS n=1 Tax=Terribacillus saccharophilus TaxID=361277 RepID=A0ABX4GYV6_9BACI|nr:DASS family sodium-coupled anion symporter [Terribacillus saccharophilus]PAD35555.1 anion transporter [Terribacillus saccharophilus]PAD96484.1 anion transporter [Terribacillus saccharophilus]PAE00060.1 anion transporter [Terribacillus saccharophilus]